jgi:cytochrome oxidase Cu insertion factor (SCO1/SenC/PrrC family)
MSSDLPPAFKIVWALVIVVILGLIGVAVWRKVAVKDSASSLNAPGGAEEESGPTPNKKELPVLFQLSDFSLKDHTGRAVSLADFRGKVWIANFIFTRCSGVCLVTNESMTVLDKELKDRQEIQLVSFTMDPEYDNPEVLAEFAKARSTRSPRWFFLTGPKEEIHRLTRENFHLTVKDSPNPQEPIIHSDLFALIDAKGQIRGYYSGVTPDKVEALSRDARKLLDRGGE